MRIFGAPTACTTGVTDAWRDVANWARRQLESLFGQQVRVENHALFSKQMDRFPEALDMARASEGAVPLVFAGSELLSAGGKVSVPAIRRRLQAMGIKPHP